MLPFSGGHPDLAATYLANNLSCLLRQQDEDDLVIYVESLQSDQPRLRTLLSLIGNNLSRYREVRVTDRKTEAGYLLRGEAYEVQSGLYQVWVVLHPRALGRTPERHGYSDLGAHPVRLRAAVDTLHRRAGLRHQTRHCSAGTGAP